MSQVIKIQGWEIRQDAIVGKRIYSNIIKVNSELQTIHKIELCMHSGKELSFNYYGKDGKSKSQIDYDSIVLDNYTLQKE